MLKYKGRVDSSTMIYFTAEEAGTYINIEQLGVDEPVAATPAPRDPVLGYADPPRTRRFGATFKEDLIASLPPDQLVSSYEAGHIIGISTPSVSAAVRLGWMNVSRWNGNRMFFAVKDVLACREIVREKGHPTTVLQKSGKYQSKKTEKADV